MKSKKLLALLGAAGVVVQTTGYTAAPTYASSTPAQLERMLQEDPMGLDAPAAFDILASRFKGPGDKGRPDVFGPPGKPDIGPPGHYEG